MTQILALDIAGNPFRWLGVERAISYSATGKVAWAIGEGELVFHGGIQRSGERSRVAVAKGFYWIIGIGGGLAAFLSLMMVLTH